MPTFQHGTHSTYYEETGAGEPVVFICGLSADLTVWRFQVAELSKTHRVITFDNRGAGRSSAPDEPYSIDQMVQDLASLLDHLSISYVQLVGWSMGGVIAQTLALSRPSRVRQLLLIGTFTAPDGHLREAIANWVNIRRSNMPYEQVVRYVARMVFSPSLTANPNAYEAFVQAMVANPYRQKVHGFLRQAEALRTYTAPPNLGSLRTPATIIVGEHDQLTPKYMSEDPFAALPRASLEVLPGAHSGFVEYPNEYNRLLLHALSQVSSRGDA